MTAAPQAGLMTADEFFDLPGHGCRELIDGVMHPLPPARGKHGGVAAELLGWLWSHVRAHQLGQVFAAETGFVVRRAPDTVRGPDVAFVRTERVDDALSPSYPVLAPDLVAEVVSPSGTASEVLGKALMWLDAGVRLVWVVDPQSRTVTTYGGHGVAVLRGEDELTGGDVLPGFTVPLLQLWR